MPMNRGVKGYFLMEYGAFDKSSAGHLYSSYNIKCHRIDHYSKHFLFLFLNNSHNFSFNTCYLSQLVYICSRQVLYDQLLLNSPRTGM